MPPRTVRWTCLSSCSDARRIILWFPKAKGVSDVRQPARRTDSAAGSDGGLLAYASVDPLAQQVRVTEVTGVLMDHSDQHLAQRHRPSAAAMLIQGIVAGDVETGRLGHEPRREVHLRTP